MNKFSLFLLLFFSGYLHAAVPTCVEKPVLLLEEFFPMPFSKSERSTVGRDQTDPIVAKIAQAATAKNIRLTEIKIFSAMSEAGFFEEKIVDGKKQNVFDPNSHDRNAEIAKTRAGLFEKSMSELKKSNSLFAEATIKIDHGAIGPEFQPDNIPKGKDSPEILSDRQLRWITKDTQGFKEKLDKIFYSYRDLYSEFTAVKSVDDLSKNYPTLFEMKFQPFQGIKVKVSGVQKCTGSKETKTPAKGSLPL